MKSFFKIIKQTLKISKVYVLFMLLSVAIYTAKSLVLVYTPNLIISKLEAGKSFSYLIKYSLVIVGINGLLELMYKYVTYQTSYRVEYINKMINYQMADKVLSIDYEHLENPEILDLKERALFAAANQGAVFMVMEEIVKTLESLITIIGLVAVMTQLGFVLNGVMLLYLALYLIFTLIVMNTQKNFYQNIVPINRKFNYYLNTLTSAQNAKDYRIYDGGGLVLNRMDNYQDKTCKEFTKFYGKLGVIMSTLTGCQYAIEGFVYYFVARRVIKHGLQVSSFSLYTSTALNFVAQTQSLVDGIIGIVQYVSYLTPFMQVLDIKDEKEEGKQIKFEGEIETIEFDHVSFTYPRQTKIILNDISFRINKGECISIVGLNGAGKTTLIKLLCRLYRPTSGEIRINGINVFDYELDSYNKHISCVFQDFKLFGYSLKDNISPLSSEEEGMKILHDLGLDEKIKSLPDGINSMLNKQLDEDGIEMSGGQLQKLAIARALYKDSDLVILDEPTSALDPKSEADIYENFNSLTKNKTSIYISHRMSSSTFSTKVLVLNNGVVEDFDTHTNLLKKDTIYKKLFETQANNYLN